MSTPWRRRIIVAAFLTLAFLLARSLQEELGISFTVEGLEQFRQWVQGLGWLGPVVLVLLFSQLPRQISGVERQHQGSSLDGFAFGSHV